MEEKEARPGNNPPNHSRTKKTATNLLNHILLLTVAQEVEEEVDW